MFIQKYEGCIWFDFKKMTKSDEEKYLNHHKIEENF